MNVKLIMSNSAIYYLFVSKKTKALSICNAYKNMLVRSTWLLLISFFAIHTYGQVPFTCKGQYYLSLTSSGSLNSGLYEVKINTNGQNIYLDTISSGIGLRLNAMGYRITDNFIYGMDPNLERLRKVGADGVAIDLGVPKDIPTSPLYYAGDVTPDGRYLLLIGLGGVTQIVKVDLEDPEYQCSFVPMKDNTVSIVDIAFDPFTGILYGHDFRNKRLVIIDPNTGDVNTNFAVQPLVDQLGALFFDSFGNLYGYGSYGTLDQDKFVSINKFTGDISLLAQGPSSSGQDGCACPYTLELQKTVVPEIAYPCTDVVYNFIVSNGSGTGRQGIDLIDTMPLGLTAKEVISNPFGGQVALNGNILSITNMDVSVGIDTIKVLVEVGPDALGLYRNQAVLLGLPPALGSFSLSDNPATIVEQDSTDLLIEPFDLSYLQLEYSTCPGDSVFVDAALYGITYLWSDGDTSAQKWMISPSEYQLTASSDCEDLIVDFEVKSDLATVNIIPESIEVALGDSIILTANYMSPTDEVSFEWEADNNTIPSCVTCQSVMVTPLFDGYYTVSMTTEDGCIISDKVYVRVIKNRDIYFPNIISANGDGSNDIFYLSGNGNASQGVYLRIYDRWGNLVFDSGAFFLNNSLYGWDGTFKGVSVVNGVYTWVSEVYYLDGFISILKGNVTVVK